MSTRIIGPPDAMLLEISLCLASSGPRASLRCSSDTTAVRGQVHRARSSTLGRRARAVYVSIISQTSVHARGRRGMWCFCCLEVRSERSVRACRERDTVAWGVFVGEASWLPPLVTPLLSCLNPHTTVISHTSLFTVVRTTLQHWQYRHRPWALLC